jgi:hypothetical protein
VRLAQRQDVWSRAPIRHSSCWADAALTQPRPSTFADGPSSNNVSPARRSCARPASPRVGAHCLCGRPTCRTATARRCARNPLRAVDGERSRLDRRPKRRPQPSSPRARARSLAMASRGRLSPGASASNNPSTRSAQSAAHTATIRRSTQCLRRAHTQILPPVSGLGPSVPRGAGRTSRRARWSSSNGSRASRLGCSTHSAAVWSGGADRRDSLLEPVGDPGGATYRLMRRAALRNGVVRPMTTTTTTTWKGGYPLLSTSNLYRNPSPHEALGSGA